ncbi:MAG: aldo/keto reductase [Bryobacteraceae bacterium]
MEYRTLGKTGLSVSLIGFGASPLGDEFRKTDPAEGARAVHSAIDQGINFFDVSPYYGRTLAEERLGAALNGRRDKVILATKCGRYDKSTFDFSAQRLYRSIDESLARLRTDYVDLLQLHDIEFADYAQIVEEAVPALRVIQRSGKARFIGITGLPLKILHAVASAVDVDSILSYCRYNFLITDLDKDVTPLCRQRNIGLINASPLHMGVLTNHGAPDWHPAPEAVKDAGRRVAETCSRYGVDVSSVALRFCLNHPDVASTLVGMADPAHVLKNIATLDLEVEPALLAEIAAIVAPVKDITWSSGEAVNNDADPTPLAPHPGKA